MWSFRISSCGSRSVFGQVSTRDEASAHKKISTCQVLQHLVRSQPEACHRRRRAGRDSTPHAHGRHTVCTYYLQLCLSLRHACGAVWCTLGSFLFRRGSVDERRGVCPPLCLGSKDQSQCDHRQHERRDSKNCGGPAVFILVGLGFTFVFVKHVGDEDLMEIVCAIVVTRSRLRDGLTGRWRERGLGSRHWRWHGRRLGRWNRRRWAEAWCWCGGHRTRSGSWRSAGRRWGRSTRADVHRARECVHLAVAVSFEDDSVAPDSVVELGFDGHSV